MKLTNLFPLSALTSALILAGCGGDININAGSGGTDPVTPPPVTSPTEEAYGDFASRSTSIASVDGKEVWTLSGTLSGEITLGSDVVWELSGAVIVGGDNENSGVLTIAEGTQILGNSNAYLVISRGSRIEAVGSATNPIVFSSVEAGLGLSTDRGQWGGLVLLGNAPVNSCTDLAACDAQFEIGDHLYGGNQEDDNSGTLKYVRVENGGFKLNDTQEMNGISFAGVGSGTQVSYIQVDKNDDDGIEFWGGNVNISNVVLTGNFDDSLDWTNGWQGAGQFIYIQTEDNFANRGIEADNNSKNRGATPVSSPVLANVTLSLGGGNNGGDDAEGILLREGTAGHLYSVLVQGGLETGECLELNHDETAANADSGMLTLEHSLIDCVEPVKNIKDEQGNVIFDTQAWFMAQEGNLLGAADLDGYLPNASSPALGNGKANLANIDARLVDTDYIGAFDGSNDWTLGWTTGLHDADEAPVAELQPLASCPVGTTNDAAQAALITGADLVCVLDGELTQNTTLLAGSNVWYQLAEGAVQVGQDIGSVDNAAQITLGIEAGVNVYANAGSYLLVNRGSKIMAQGNATHPITFTSASDALDGLTPARGDWGGLVLLGQAPVNSCADLANCDAQFEIGNHLYGGNLDEDSSGMLSHVVVKWGGFKLNDTQEMNGISFAAVGSGTQVDHIHVHGNDDDGVEFWGGSVNLKYIYLTDNNDDSLDWTNGWTGKAQYVYVTQLENRANRGVEGDNNSNNRLAMPVSLPTVSNLTLVLGGGNNGGDDSEGIIFREGTGAHFSNTLIKGTANTGECLELNHDETVAVLNDGNLTLTHSLIDCVEPVKNMDSFDTTAWFQGQEGNQIVEFGAIELTGGQPAAGSAALGAGKDMSQEDPFFDMTDYIGAFDGTNDWTAGWSYSAQ